MEKSKENLRQFIIKNFTKKEALNAAKKLNGFSLEFLTLYFVNTKLLKKHLDSLNLNTKKQRYLRKLIIEDYLEKLDEERIKRDE